MTPPMALCVSLLGVMNIGQRTYTVTDVQKSSEEYHTGVCDAFEFVTFPFPENILAWTGGSILGALETLSERYLSLVLYG